MPWGTCNRLIQKRKEPKMLFPYGNAWRLSTSLKDCGRWGHVFAASASPRVGPNGKSGHVTLFRCLWWSGRYQICDIRVSIACGIRGGEDSPRSTWTNSLLYVVSYGIWIWSSIHMYVRYLRNICFWFLCHFERRTRPTIIIYTAHNESDNWLLQLCTTAEWY